MDNASSQRSDRNLVLIGYRATGKTSVGAKLARVLKRPFVDLDRVLVGEAGQSVAEIVARGGWDEFRRREKELVARYHRRPGPGAGHRRRRDSGSGKRGEIKRKWGPDLA